MRKRTSFPALLLLILSGLACADSTLVYERVSGDGQGRNQPPMQIADGMLRMAPQDSSNNQYMLYDRHKNTFTIVDTSEGTCTPMDAGTFEQIGQAQKQAMDQMQAQLAQLPPEQREQVMRMMGDKAGLLGMGEKTKVHTERTSRTLNVGGHTCTVLEVYRGDRKISETCVTSREALGMPADDYQTLMAMQELLMSISSQFFEMEESSYFYGDASRQEMPVHIVDFQSTGKNTTQFRSASFDDIDPAVFEIDPSFRKKDIMSEMSR